MIIFRKQPPRQVNIYMALLVRLLIILLLLTVSRFIFYWLNPSYFPGLTGERWWLILQGGLRFDIAAIFYVNAVYIFLQIIPFRIRYHAWYQRAARAVFAVTNGLALLVNTVDMIYFRFTLRRSTLDVFREFQQEEGKGSFLLRFALDYWYLVLFFVLMVMAMMWLYNRVAVKKPEPFRPWLFYPAGLALMAGIIALMVGGIRGDFRHSTRPITMSNAGQYVKSSGDIPLVLNTPFCMIRTAGRSFYKKENFFQPDEAERIYTPVQQLNSEQPFRYDNVVVIILESFGREGIGFFNSQLDNGNYKGYTPFLDSLCSVSFVSSRSFANGRKSIDALPAVLAGVPAGEVPFVLTPYASNKMKSLPAILKEKGYATSFFHGAPNGSMGFKAFVNLMGVSDYYGKDEFKNDAEFDGLWGIWDEPFFQFFAHTLDTVRQPFFSTIFSVSSHHPFKVPSKYKNKFPKGTLPIHQCMGYTDMALRRFFETAAKADWYRKTLFVITADHATLSSFPEYQTTLGNVSVPVIFYHPGDTTLQGMTSRLLQQTDIMPSVLGYLGYSGPVFSFGKNIFDSTSSNFAVNYMNGYHLAMGDYLLDVNDRKEVAGLYNYQSDPFLKQDSSSLLPAVRDSLSLRLRAFIQQYHNRLIEDRMLP